MKKNNQKELIAAEGSEKRLTRDKMNLLLGYLPKEEPNITNVEIMNEIKVVRKGRYKNSNSLKIPLM